MTIRSCGGSATGRSTSSGFASGSARTTAFWSSTGACSRWERRAPPTSRPCVVSPTSARRRSATRWTFTALTPASSTSRRRSSRRNRWLLPPRATPTSSSGPRRRATSRSSSRHCFPACGASARSGSGSPRVAAPPMSATPSGSICTPRRSSPSSRRGAARSPTAWQASYPRKFGSGVAAAFLTSSRYELAFWQMAWEGERWLA